MREAVVATLAPALPGPAGVNYFEHHIGDYDEATSHLTACEDGIYHRMLRKYYAKEAPLVADVLELKRQMRARSVAERKAVDRILAEFFTLEADGWHQSTCDEVLAAFAAGEPDRTLKKVNEDNRLKRHREERARLFRLLTDTGRHAAWNIPMGDLRKLVEALPAMPSATPPATATATPATATQYPLPTTHSPKQEKEIRDPPAGGPSSPSGESPRKPGGEKAGGYAPPDCPHVEIVALWGEVLPALPQPLKWQGLRADNLRARWRETAVDKRWTSTAQGLAFFRKVFRFVGQSDFLCGRGPQRGDRGAFIVELPWLVRPENFLKVLEGKYHPPKETP